MKSQILFFSFTPYIDIGFSPLHHFPKDFQKRPVGDEADSDAISAWAYATYTTLLNKFTKNSINGPEFPSFFIAILLLLLLFREKNKKLYLLIPI